MSRLYFKGVPRNGKPRIRFPSWKSLGKSEEECVCEDKSITDDIRVAENAQKKQNLVLTSKTSIARDFA